MSSRQEQKAQARAAREAAERQQASTARRQRRLYGLGAAVLVAVAIVVIAVVASSGGDDKPVATGSDEAAATVAAVNRQLRGIPQSGSTLGSPSAPVEMVYFGDLQCPVCKDFTEAGLQETITKQVRPGKLKIRFRSMQTATQDQNEFVRQQTAALAAGEQDKLWYYIELFYRQQGVENSGYVTDDHLTSIAEQVTGLDVAKWETDRSAQKLVEDLSADAAEAQRVGATGTPTLLVTGPKGTKAASGLSYDDIASLIAEVD